MHGGFARRSLQSCPPPEVLPESPRGEEMLGKCHAHAVVEGQCACRQWCGSQQLKAPEGPRKHKNASCPKRSCKGRHVWKCVCGKWQNIKSLQCRRSQSCRGHVQQVAGVNVCPPQVPSLQAACNMIFAGGRGPLPPGSPPTPFPCEGMGRSKNSLP